MAPNPAHPLTLQILIQTKTGNVRKVKILSIPNHINHSSDNYPENRKARYEGTRDL